MLFGNKNGPFIKSKLSQVGPKKLKAVNFLEQTLLLVIIFDGKTKFGSDRFINGLLDLITLLFLKKFGKRPMHFFGFLGTMMLIVGFGFTIYLGINKLYFNQGARLISQRPEFYIALATMILGAQFFIAGFLAELILKFNLNKDKYSIKNKTF